MMLLRENLAAVLSSLAKFRENGGTIEEFPAAASNSREITVLRREWREGSQGPEWAGHSGAWFGGRALEGARVKPRADLLLARLDGLIAGACSLRHGGGIDGREALELADLGVLREGKGVGTALASAAASRAINLGLGACGYPLPMAHGFWRSLGWDVDSDGVAGWNPDEAALIAGALVSTGIEPKGKGTSFIKAAGDLGCL